MTDLPVAPRSHRWWMPITSLLLGGAGLTLAWMQPELETNLRSWLISAVVLLTGVLILLWFLLFSRYPGRTRLLVAGLLVLAGVGLKAALRIDGAVSGTGLPKYRWVWAQPEDKQFAPVVEAAKPTLTDVPDVPQFLGLNRDGILTDVGISADWKKQPPRQLWRVNVGEGWGAFCVVGGRAITMEQRDAEEWVTAYDLGTGKVLWYHADKTRFTEWQGGDGPRSTPTHDAGKVYTLGATGVVNCLEAETGRVVWTHSLMKDFGMENLTWGFASSPLIVDDLVIVAGAKKPGPTLVAYDKISGVMRWKSGSDEATYASPNIARLAGRQVIVLNNAPGLSLVDPKNGEVLLNHAWGVDKWPKASQPVVLPGDRVFMSAGYGMGCILLQIKTDAQGKLSAASVWENHKMKTQFNSVTPRGDLLLGLDDGRFAAMEIASGERLWKEGRFGAGQHLLVGDKVLVQGESGEVVLGEPARTGFKQLATLPALNSKTWNYPTLAGRWLLVRNDREAVCYELPLAGVP